MRYTLSIMVFLFAVTCVNSQNHVSDSDGVPVAPLKFLKDTLISIDKVTPIPKVKAVIEIGQTLETKELPLETFKDGPDCGDWRAEAADDVAKGILKFISFGYPVQEYEPFTRHDALWEDYGIGWENRGCVITGSGHECYNDYMDSVIRKKFGDDVYIKARKKSDSLTFWNVVKTMPEFHGGEKKLLSRAKNWEKEWGTLCPDTSGSIDVNILIGKDGKPIKATVYSGFCEKINNILIKHLLEQPKWKPAISGIDKKMEREATIWFYFKKGKLERVEFPLIGDDAMQVQYFKTHSKK